MTKKVEVYKKRAGGVKGRSGVYPRKPFTEEHKKNMGKSHTGEKNGLWKGDKAKYRAIHTWIERQLGKPRFCEDCGNREKGHRHYHWANIDHNYKRITTDWRRLCAKCHQAFDRRVKSGNI